jgi:mitotic spindle assembly checkpoint protein MAD2
MLAGKLDSLALIIMNRDTREVVERWQFDVHVEEVPVGGTTAGAGEEGKENDGCVCVSSRTPGSLLSAGLIPSSHVGTVEIVALPRLTLPPSLSLPYSFFVSRPAAAPAPLKSKTEKTPEQVQKDIQDIMRQITSSVTFLPSLEEKCAFSSLHSSSFPANQPFRRVA